MLYQTFPDMYEKDNTIEKDVQDCKLLSFYKLIYIHLRHGCNGKMPDFEASICYVQISDSLLFIKESKWTIAFSTLFSQRKSSAFNISFNFTIY